MEGQPRIEELLNKIIFLKKALEFYANDKNYNPENPKVMVDQGYQANFALEQIKEIEKYNQQLINDFDEAISDQRKMEDISDIVDQELLNKLDKIMKKYKQKYGD